MSHVNELRHKFHTLFTHFVDSIQKQTVSLGLCIGVHSQRKSYFIVKTWTMNAQDHIIYNKRPEVLKYQDVFSPL